MEHREATVDRVWQMAGDLHTLSLVISATKCLLFVISILQIARAAEYSTQAYFTDVGGMNKKDCVSGH